MKTTTPVRDSTTVYDDDFTPLIVSVPTAVQHYCSMEASAALRFRKVPTLFFSNPQLLLEQAHFCRECGKHSWVPVPVVEEDAK